MEEAETGMSERIGFSVEIEGAEETIGTLTTMQSDLMKVTSLIGTVDYAFTSWQRVTEEFSIENFLRSILATITFMQNLIMLTNAATVAQWNLNAAQAAGGVSGGTGLAGMSGLAGMLGPIGMLLSLSLSTILSIRSVVNKLDRDHARLAEQIQREGEAHAYNRALYADALEAVEERRREKYRSVVP